MDKTMKNLKSGHYKDTHIMKLEYEKDSITFRPGHLVIVPGKDKWKWEVYRIIVVDPNKHTAYLAEYPETKVVSIEIEN